MKQFTKVLSLFMLTVVLLGSGCDDDDAPVDPFEDLTKNGNVVISMSGEDPQGQPFSAVVDYKYMPDGSFQTSRVNPAFGDENGVVFSINRKLNILERSGSSDYWVDVVLAASTTNGTVTFPNQYISFAASVLDPDTRSFFEVRALSNETSVSDYSYNPATGELKFTLTATVPDLDHNLSGDLSVTVDVDVIVFSQVNASSRMLK